MSVQLDAVRLDGCGKALGASLISLRHMDVCPVKVRRLHTFVKERYPDAECLETVAVSRGVVEQLNAVADEAVARDSWFEVRVL